MDRNQQLFDRAKLVIPGGVNSPVRAFRGVGGEPFFVERASGAIPAVTPGATPPPESPSEPAGPPPSMLHAIRA